MDFGPTRQSLRAFLNRLSYQLCDYFPGVDRWKATPLEVTTPLPPEHLDLLAHRHNVGYWCAAYEAHVRLEEAATKMTR